MGNSGKVEIKEKWEKLMRAGRIFKTGKICQTPLFRVSIELCGYWRIVEVMAVWWVNSLGFHGLRQCPPQLYACPACLTREMTVFCSVIWRWLELHSVHLWLVLWLLLSLTLLFVIVLLPPTLQCLLIILISLCSHSHMIGLWLYHGREFNVIPTKM